MESCENKGRQQSVCGNEMYTEEKQEEDHIREGM